jgi:hypothetical protein
VTRFSISGDRTRLESFLKVYQSTWPLDEMVQWSTDTGGYDVLEVNASNRTNRRAATMGWPTFSRF